MENLESLKGKLIRAIKESADRQLILRLWNSYAAMNEIQTVSEPETIYDSEKPMTEKEVEAYFAEETIALPDEIVEILKISEEQIRKGEVYTNEEVQNHFDEWLKK